MSEATATSPSDEPTGHYGPGYGEKDAPPGSAVPSTPSTTADDITSKPPVDPPEPGAPESEKAALVFERS